MYIYLDHNATTRPDPEVAVAVSRALSETWGNPSTLSEPGRRAREALHKARTQVAALVGALEPGEILFTSGGTEADNLAIRGTCWALAHRGDHVVTTLVEHAAVLRSCALLEREGFRVTYLPVDGFGRVDPEDVRRAVTPRTVLVSVMLANNEVGTLNAVPEIGTICREVGVPLHTDAVQAMGRTPVEVETLRADLVSLSGHKFYGPRGVGALWVRQGNPLEPILGGGRQERGFRPGTEDVAGIVGLGLAAELARGRLVAGAKHVSRLRNRLWEGLREALPGVRAHGVLAGGLPNTLNVSFPGWGAEDLVLALDAEGIAVGTGSACSTGRTTPSHVLLAMGVPPREARSCLRFSLGRGNTEKEIDHTVAVLLRLCATREVAA